MAKSKKYYAVRNGLKTGIFDTWEECKEQVTGYTGASYKSFKSLDDAIEYMDYEDVTMENGSVSLETIKDGELICYVDGSCKSDGTAFSYGLVAFSKGYKVEKYKSYELENTELRNVAGEIEGAIEGMRIALNDHFHTLYLHYDYEGIQKWATEDWKARNDFAQRYVDIYKLVKKKVDVRFVKVKAHTGDKYNEVADSLAKESLGIKE